MKNSQKFVDIAITMREDEITRENYLSLVALLDDEELPKDVRAVALEVFEDGQMTWAAKWKIIQKSEKVDIWDLLEKTKK